MHARLARELEHLAHHRRRCRARVRRAQDTAPLKTKDAAVATATAATTDKTISTATDTKRGSLNTAVTSRTVRACPLSPLAARRSRPSPAASVRQGPSVAEHACARARARRMGMSVCETSTHSYACA